MIGYIYLTTNTINNKKYIGKHISEQYDKNYFGSGKILKLAIKKYSIENFTNEIIDTADTVDELNQKEKYYIQFFINKYGKKNIYNIAKGGDGGDTFSMKSLEEKQEFIDKMTEINKERCNTEDFKKKLSIAGKRRYSDINARIEHSERIRKAWSNETLKQEQSDRLKEYYKTHKKDSSYMNKPCIFKLNDIYKEFDSKKQLMEYLKENYGHTLCRRTLKKLFETGEPYNPFNHKKMENLVGMIVCYKQNENVETMGDECNPVENEIGTFSKCETEIEEIVHSA